MFNFVNTSRKNNTASLKRERTDHSVTSIPIEHPPVESSMEYGLPDHPEDPTVESSLQHGTPDNISRNSLLHLSPVPSSLMIKTDPQNPTKDTNEKFSSLRPYSSEKSPESDSLNSYSPRRNSLSPFPPSLMMETNRGNQTGEDIDVKFSSLQPSTPSKKGFFTKGFFTERSTPLSVSTNHSPIPEQLMIATYGQNQGIVRNLFKEGTGS
jgi:hypothetical protein